MLSLFVVACAFLVSIIAAPSAKADVSPAPYLDPAYEDPFWDLVTGEAWPETFPASWAAPAAEDVAAAAGAMPALSTLGTFILGAGAFDLGWKIGRTIDTKWLHLSGDLGTRAQTTPEVVKWEWRTSAFCTSSWTSGSCEQNVWLGRTTSYTYYCDPYRYPACPYPKWLYDQMEALPGTRVTVLNQPGGMCGGSPGPCYAKILIPNTMEGRLIHGGWVDYTNQSVGQTTFIPAPTKTTSSLTAAQQALTNAGPEAQYEFNCTLDPEHWSCPDGTGSGGGPKTLAWPGPQLDESYSTYLSRLRALGWVGTATIVDLNDETGDANFGPSGVPCTSVAPGANIAPADGVTFYRNPASFGLGGSGGLTCGWSNSSTPSDPRECDWPNEVTPSWHDAMTGSNAAFYQQACEDAWAYFEMWGGLDASGNLAQAVIDGSHNILDGVRIADTVTIAALTSDGSSMNDWEKASTDTYPFTYPFQVHFYRTVDIPHVAGNVGIKVKFNQYFEP